MVMIAEEELCENGQTKHQILKEITAK